MKSSKMRQYLSSLLQSNKGASLILLSINTLLICIWFREGYIISYAEHGLWMYNNRYQAFIAQYLWFDVFNTGGLWGFFNFTLPFQSVLATLEAIGFTPLMKEIFVFYLELAIASLSMYGLNYHFTKRASASIIASLIYTFNPFSMIYVWHRYVGMDFSFFVFPLTMYLYIKGVDERRYSMAIIMGFSIFLFSMVFLTNPVLLIILPFSYFVYKVVLDRRDWKFILRFTTFTVAISILLLSAFLYAVLIGMGQAYYGLEHPYPTFYGWPLLDTIRLIVPIISFEKLLPPYQANPLYIWTSFMLPLLAFAALLNKEFATFKIYFACLSLIGLLMSWLTLYAYDLFYTLLDLPFANIVLNIFSEKALYLTSIGYSVLVGCSASQFWNRSPLMSFKKVLKNTNGNEISKKPLMFFKKVMTRSFPRQLLALLLLLLLIVNVQPMLSGALFTNPYPLWTGEPLQQSSYKGYVKVPQYYSELVSYLQKDNSSFKLLSLPLVLGAATYDWQPDGFSGSHVDWQLLPYPIITAALESENSFYTQQIVSQLPTFMLASANWYKLLDVLNVKYIIVHGDIHLNSYVYPPSAFSREEFKSILTQVPVEINQTPITFENIELKGLSSSVFVEKINNRTVIVEGKADMYGLFGLYIEIPEHLRNFTDKLLRFSITTNVTSALEVQLYTPLHILSYTVNVFPSAQPFNITIVPQIPNNIYPRQANVSSWDGSLDKISTLIIRLYNLRPHQDAKFEISNIDLIHIAKRRSDRVAYIGTFGEIDLYENLGVLPRVLIGDKVKSFSDYLHALIYMAYDKNFDPNRSIVLVNNSLKISEELAMPDFYSFQQISPTQYEVSIKNATKPFLLVLLESYDQRWKAIIQGKELPSSDHFLAYGYANGWYITKPGNYTITLEYTPQRMFTLLLLVSLSGYSLIIIATILRKRMMIVKIADRYEK